MPQEFYEEKEAEEILRLATRQQFNGGMTRDALLRMASEVGLSEAEVVAAEQKYRSASDEQELAALFAKRQRANFIAEVLGGIGVNAFMVAIWWMSGRGSFWPGWLMVPSIYGAFDMIPKHLMPASSSYQKAFAKWKAKGALMTEDEDEEERAEEEQNNQSGLRIRIRAGRGRRR
jgi:hypothetical protein